MNRLIEVLLSESGFRWDPSAYETMCEEFDNTNSRDLQEFTDRAATMPYQEFLKTVYWGVVSGFIISRNPWCSSCRTTFALQVHHTHYDWRGYEWAHPECLRVLCMYCHKSVHGLATAEEEAVSMRNRRYARELIARRG